MARDTTVVVTNFNYGRYVGEAVESVLSQDHAAEVIVVDDGSTEPGTDAALDALPDGVRVVRQANQGVAAARNAGLELATTPFVLCLDADDHLASGALSALRSALEEHPSAGFAYGHQRWFGAWSGVMRMPPYDPLVLLDRHVIGLTALMRAEVVRDTGGFDEDVPAFEDWELWLHALARGWSGVRVDAVVLEYRRHEGAKQFADRRRYRATRRYLREKHAALYARRRALAESSSLGVAGRALHRAYWGPRPLPAQIESGLYHLMFRRRAGAA